MDNRVLQNIEPEEVFHYFEDLSRIPRESGNEKQATDYLISFAKVHGLEWYRDDALNVLIRKEASPGYESHPGIILQGHTDMVCEKNENTVHDFAKDPIKIVVDGDKITAQDTTLGADDGIGIALALALLADDKLSHPMLEVLCTSDEERGMHGVEAFDTSLLKGQILINLDSNEETIFTVGCAGGPAVRTEIPIARDEMKSDATSLQIKISGLMGGHSGEDIHLGRANSIKLMARLLLRIEREVGMQLLDLGGGLKYNAIPREANAVIAVSDSSQKKVETILTDFTAVLRNEYRNSDPDISITMEPAKTIENARPMSSLSVRSILNYILFAENGVTYMDMEFKDTVESSVSLGVARTEQDKAVFQTLTRSSLSSRYMEMYYKIVRLAESVGGKVQLMSNCPEWEYNPNSQIKNIFHDTYKRMFGKDPGYVITHAGLECGVIKKKSAVPIDMIAAGPIARNLHTPGEYVSISSTARFWKFLQEVVKAV